MDFVKISPMSYDSPFILKEKRWNNIFSYDFRTNKTLTIPSLKEGTIADIEIGDTISFEEIEGGVVKSCIWLKYFIRISHPTRGQLPTGPITLFDNHNHALYFWLEAIRNGLLEPWFELIHIDEHSDLWHNENILDPEKAISDETYAWEFTNFSCNVGNYIEPTINAGIVAKIIRIENEFELDEHIDYRPMKNSVLNLDLDFFAPEMDFISETKKIRCIRNLMKYVQCITIATSPYFIDQWRAIEKLKKILMEE